MRRRVHLYILLTAVIVVGLGVAPAPALAQHHPGPYTGHTRVYVGVGIGAGWGYPYWGYPYWGWGPYWGLGWGAYWGWGGPWYGYGYGYPWWGYYPPDNSSEVKLEITPKDAQVYVDGYYLGIVDDFDGMFQKMHVPPGEHELVIYKPAFRTVKQSIRLRPRQDSKIRYAMEPLPAGETAEAPPPPPKREEPQRSAAPPRREPPYAQPAPPGSVEARTFGTVVFRVQPAGAEILVDGQRWQGPDSEDRLVVQLSEGSHRVEIRKEGFVPFSTDVTVRGGETTPLNVSLPPRE